jgi:hypothetical protein
LERSFDDGHVLSVRHLLTDPGRRLVSQAAHPHGRERGAGLEESLGRDQGYGLDGPVRLSRGRRVLFAAMIALYVIFA